MSVKAADDNGCRFSDHAEVYFVDKVETVIDQIFERIFKYDDIQWNDLVISTKLFRRHSVLSWTI